jgi:16S rRNA (guanine966-N2)-methyltransferase
MTRIIAGSVGGRRIHTPPGHGPRPTSDRVREALFSRLEHLEVLHEARVLDLYAGSGALGLECSSRGAAFVTLVESARPAAAVARRNVKELGLHGVDVRADTVERVLRSGPPLDAKVDLVLADPPYPVTQESLGEVLRLLVAHDWLVDEALLVVERSTRSPEPLWPGGIELIGPRRYGETTLWFAEAVGEGDIA